MIDNTILAGGAAQAPEITVDAAGLITATAGSKVSTLQQQTGAFSYSPAGDAFYTAHVARLVAQGYMPGVEAVVVERNWDVNNIAFTHHAFPLSDGSTMTLGALAIPLTYPVAGGKSGILSFAVCLIEGTSKTGLTYFGPINGYNRVFSGGSSSQSYYDASGRTLYLAPEIQSISADVPPSYVVVYRRA